jgi:hypothetical protein
MEVQIHAFLTSTLDVSKRSASCPDHPNSGERFPGTCWTRGWLGLNVGLETAAKRGTPYTVSDGN